MVLRTFNFFGVFVARLGISYTTTVICHKDVMSENSIIIVHFGNKQTYENCLFELETHFISV